MDLVCAHQPRYPRVLPELLTAMAELLTRYQPHNAPMLHSARTVQQVTRVEFDILDVLGFELATPTPAAWVEISDGVCLSLGITTAAAAAILEPSLIVRIVPHGAFLAQRVRCVSLPRTTIMALSG